ncbi:phosphotransferase family protein [Aspergillus saccharolyticus JOP 1030-1]|uniref:APH-domain-containing protein n=1 Tax=Aspergillus saccharolyticus JOP 1030-1 TaxID=1450539 RepID=A0A318Z867_9EURO|nr:APH-domain-containing protein [Aspergillus saccharolyticus JOP 1030-1]PYH43505.1 APH-domain-containing protein [Aspergillus saccharolyticus JOP 1030-1]
MGVAPEHNLPQPYAEETILALLDSIGLSRPVAIKPLKVTAAFHLIYVLTYSREALAPHVQLDRLPASSGDETEVDLILRISGDHVPRIKTENETAILTWLREHTSIPVPEVVAFDVTSVNPVGREYLICTRCPGQAISDIYSTLSEAQLDSILLQLMHILLELHQHRFPRIGGLAFDEQQQQQRSITVGPLLDEHFWFTCDIPRYFSSTTTKEETFTTLNYRGPFDSFTDYVSAAVRSYLHVADIHPSLQESPLAPFLPRLAAFLERLPALAGDTPTERDFYLAHKDLHFANILYDPATDRITAILDWEFAGTVPYPQWDPVRAFLWNAQPGQASFEEKYRLRDRFWQLCREHGGAAAVLAQTEWEDPRLESLHLVRNALRGITTNVPRGLHPEAVARWYGELEKGLAYFQL